MAKRSRTYIWQFTIGLGFLSGLWTAIGIDPEKWSSTSLARSPGKFFPIPCSGSCLSPAHPPPPHLGTGGHTKRVRPWGSRRCSSRTWPGFPFLSRSGPRCSSFAAMVTGYLATGRRQCDPPKVLHPVTPARHADIRGVKHYKFQDCVLY